MPASKQKSEGLYAQKSGLVMPIIVRTNVHILIFIIFWVKTIEKNMQICFALSLWKAMHSANT